MLSSWAPQRSWSVPTPTLLRLIATRFAWTSSDRTGDLRQTRACASLSRPSRGTAHVHVRAPYEIDRHVDLPNVGVCLDSFHMLALGEDPSVIDSMDSSKLFFVQLADAPRLDMPVKEISRHHRLWPGHGDLPVKECLTKTLNVGYGGPVSLEIFNDSLEHDDPEVAAPDAYQALVSVARS
ncbi:sugar phosphate isomerase/epimerase family protein [uncultured Corynebacterium sp.]|uniref:sugar phosphate isomerase/epimerase family protein n=1 Tax=uncultured Corynebacterium sp. TaxID=159447 RepID=UPI00345D83C3